MRAGLAPPAQSDPGNPPSLPDSVFLASGCLTFLVALAVQYAGWSQLLRRPLQQSDPGVRRRALLRWMRYLVAWQLLILGAGAAYLISVSAAHPQGYYWPAPAVGLVLGTGFALQLALIGILRAVKR